MRAVSHHPNAATSFTFGVEYHVKALRSGFSKSLSKTVPSDMDKRCQTKGTTSDLFKRLLEDTQDSGDSCPASPESVVWDPLWGDIPASPIPEFVPPLNLPDSPRDNTKYISACEPRNVKKSKTADASGKKTSYETSSKTFTLKQDKKDQLQPTRTCGGTNKGRASKRSKARSIGSAVREISRRNLEQDLVEESNNKIRRERKPKKVESVNTLLIEEARNLAIKNSGMETSTKCAENETIISRVHRKTSSISMYELDHKAKTKERMTNYKTRNEHLRSETRKSLNSHSIYKNKVLPPIMKSDDKKKPNKVDFIVW